MDRSTDLDLSYDAIYAALRAQARVSGVEGEEKFDTSIRTLRNRARFIAERALEMPFEDRRSFVDNKVR